MFDDMKTRDHIETVPGRPLDNIRIDGSYPAGEFRQLRIGFDATSIERLPRDAEEIPSPTSDLQQFPGRLYFPDQIQSPFGIEPREPMLLFQSQMPKRDIRHANFCRRFCRRCFTKCERRSPHAD